MFLVVCGYETYTKQMLTVLQLLSVRWLVGLCIAPKYAHVRVVGSWHWE
jgi:hypothetical protein